MEIKDSSLHGNGRYHGYVADFAAMLARRVGFQYEIKLVKDAKYGNVQEDGKWTGMIGEVIRKVSKQPRIQRGATNPKGGANLLFDQNLSKTA